MNFVANKILVQLINNMAAEEYCDQGRGCRSPAVCSKEEKTKEGEVPFEREALQLRRG